MELTKQLLINAIIGKGFRGNYQDEQNMTRLGLAYFSGNQHNEIWTWSRSEIEKHPMAALEAIYKRF